MINNINKALQKMLDEVSFLCNLRILAILLCIAIFIIYWDQSEINALRSVYTTVSLATIGKTESDFRIELKSAQIQVAEEESRYSAPFFDYNEDTDDKILRARFASHFLLFSWGYEVIIFIKPKTRKIESLKVRMFGEGI